MANRAEIETFESVKDWLNFLSEGGSSETTITPYLFRFGRLCDDLKLNPDELLASAREDTEKFEKMLAAYHREKLKATTQSNIYHNWQVLKSFLKHNGVALRHKVAPPDLDDHDVPSKETLKRLWKFASTKLRAYIMFARDSGMAPVDILGLRYSKIKDELERGFDYPVVKDVRSKTGVKFHSFIGPEAVRDLKDYLGTRVDREGKSLVNNDSYLFTAYLRGQKALDYHSLQDQFKRTAKKIGSNAQVYDMRRYFMTNLQADECQETNIEKWSGHSLGINKNYRKLTIEESRAIYIKHYHALSFSEGLVKQSEMEQKDKEMQELRDRIAQMEKSQAALFEVIKPGQVLQMVLEPDEVIEDALDVDAEKRGRYTIEGGKRLRAIRRTLELEKAIEDAKRKEDEPFEPVDEEGKAFIEREKKRWAEERSKAKPAAKAKKKG